MTLPSNIILEKNKIATASAFVLLIELTLPTLQKFYLTANNEDVTFDSQLYTALPIEVDATKQSLKGEIPSVTLKLSNVTRLLRYYIESSNGAIGSTVKLTVVNTEYLNETYTELELSFDVTGLSVDAMWVYLTLGPPNPLRRRFPLYRYISDRCRYVAWFKGVECKYAGADTTCKGSLADCEAKSNSTNFGGFPGLGSGSFKVA